MIPPQSKGIVTKLSRLEIDKTYTQSENHNTILNALDGDPIQRASFFEGILLHGAFRESNSRPLAPEARIIPLDQMPLKDMHI